MNNNNNNKPNVLLDKLKNIMHLKEDPDVPSIRQCTPIFGFHFPWRSQTYFLPNTGLSPRSPIPNPLNFHYSYNVKDYTYTYLPKYDQHEKTKRHLKQRMSLQEMDVCWHVYAPRGSHMKLQRTEADTFHSISIPSQWHTLKCEAKKQSQEPIFRFWIFLYTKCRHFPTKT